MHRATWLFFGIFAMWNGAAIASDGEPLPHWSYAPDDGPTRWADLSPEYALCREGLRQSPIDLVGKP